MWQPQEVADSLASTIQRLQSQRETGQLIVKHGKGATVEEGIIIFNNGRVTEARIGSRSGSDVFNRMSRWENFSWSFVRPIMDTPAASYSYGSPNTGPIVSTGNLSNSYPNTPVDSLQFQVEPTEKVTRKLSQDVPFTQGAPRPICQYQTGLQMIDRLGLSRSHRRLFLLIDGRRSVPDLIRLMAKELDDVDKLLQDLERIAIIHYSPMRYKA